MNVFQTNIIIFCIWTYWYTLHLRQYELFYVNTEAVCSRLDCMTWACFNMTLCTSILLKSFFFSLIANAIAFLCSVRVG